LALPQIVVTVADHKSDPMRKMYRKKLDAKLHKRKCVPYRVSYLPVSEDSHFVFSVYQ